MPALAAITILPLGIYRITQADWIIAALDICIFILMLTIGYNAYHNKRIELLKQLFCLLAIVGSFATIYLKGAIQIYWSYPVIAIIFYLLRVRIALIVCFLALTGYTILTYPLVSTLASISFLITQIVTAGCAFAFSFETSKQHQALTRMTKTDPLTQTYNRRAFQEILQTKLDNYHRHPEPTSMILLDIDFFKNINDQYGHQQGDEVLKQLCHVIKQRLRKNDYLFRVGGEEFVILPFHSNSAEANILAESIRAEVHAYCFITDHPITISCGVSEYTNKQENPKDWYARTDKALYKAKATRNKVCLADNADDQTNQSLACK